MMENYPQGLDQDFGLLKSDRQKMAEPHRLLPSTITVGSNFLIGGSLSENRETLHMRLIWEEDVDIQNSIRSLNEHLFDKA